MTRKLLSSVLAFTMIFGATMPMAIAEEAAPVAQEEVEQVEQYAVYDVSIADAKIGTDATSKATIGIVSGLTGKSDVVWEFTPSSSDIKASINTAKDTITVAATKALTAATTYTIGVKISVPTSYNASGMDDFTKTTTNGYDVFTKTTPITITVDANVAIAKQTATLNGVTLASGTSATQPIVTNRTITAAFVYNAGASDSKDVKPYSVSAIVTTSGKDYVSATVSDVTEGDASKTIVELKGLKATSSTTNARVQITVKYTSTGSAVVYEIPVTVTAQTNVKDVTSLVVTPSKYTISAGGATNVIAQAKTMNDYGTGTVDADDAPLEWYVNGTKVALGSSYKTIDANGVYTDAVRLDRISNDSYITFTGVKGGTYVLKAVAVNGGIENSATITVNASQNKPTDISFTKKDGTAIDGPWSAANGVISNAKKTNNQSASMVAGNTYDIIAKTAPVVANGTTVEYVGNTSAIKGGFKYTLTQSTRAATTELKILTVPEINQYVKIDANGVVTVDTSLPMTSAFNVLMTSTADTSKVFTLEFTAEKPSTSPAKMQVKVGGTTIAAAAQNATGSYVVKSGEPAKFDATVLNAQGVTTGVNQKVIWTIVYGKNYEGTASIAEDGTLNATFTGSKVVVDNDGANNALKLVGYSEANQAVMANITITVLPGDAKPTVAPTATTAPTTAPTAAPTAKPTEKPATTLDGVVTASSLNVRDLPDGTKLGSLKKGASVKITAITDDGKWYEIEYKGGKAYVSSAYVEIKTAEEAVYATVKTSGGSLNMRASASSSASVLVKIPNGATVKVLAVGATWTKVEYNGKTGYCATQYLEVAEDSVG